MIEYYNPTTGKQFIRNASTATQIRQGAFKWSVNNIPHETHNPSHEQLITVGYYKREQPIYDPETEKITDEDIITGEVITKVIIPLTAEELAADAETKFNIDMDVIDQEWTPRMREDMWRVATGQITHAELESDYRAAVNDPAAILPIDAWMAKKVTRREAG